MKKYFICILGLYLNFVACKRPSDTSIPVDFCALIQEEGSGQNIGDMLSFQDSSAVDGSGAFVLEEGDLSMMVRAWLTQQATRSIDIQYFIFSVDNIGLIACDYLVRAADRGVKVRILVDDIMVEADEEDILILDAHENIEIKIYNPGINIGKSIPAKLSKIVTDFKDINRRMHNKIFIADRQAAITGGRNIADEYFDYDHEYNFRDRDILLTGKVIKDMQHSFDEFWNHTLSVPISALIEGDSTKLYAPDRYDKLHQYACNPDNYWPPIREKISRLPVLLDSISRSETFIFTDSIYYISDKPGKNYNSKSWSGDGITSEALTDLFLSARSTVDIQTPYLITTPEVRKLFKDAVNRGVKVRILTNSLASTDNVEAFSGYQRDRNALLATGVSIFEFKPDAEVRKEIMTGALQEKLNYTPIFGLHAKTMVIDGHITVIGTFNLDPRSAHLNTECITVVHSGSLSKNVLRGMEEEFKPENAWQTTIEFNPDHTVSTVKRIKTLTRRIIPKNIL
jgi:cardiolipin synthase C